MNEIDNIIVLEDEDNNEISFEFLDLIIEAASSYVVLLPLNNERKKSNIVILKEIATHDGAEVYESVDNKETRDAVLTIFKEKEDYGFNLNISWND